MTKSALWWDYDRGSPLSCPGCGWTGTSSTDLEELFTELLEVSCPRCGRVLLFVVFPTLQETRDSAAAGNRRAIEGLPEIEAEYEERMRRRAQLLRSPDELPELPDEPLVIVWDIIDDEDPDSTDPWQVLVHEGTIIWREPAYYESYKRFEEVFGILRERYGSRFRELQPTESASWWLYGDRLGAPAVVEGLNRSLTTEHSSDTAGKAGEDDGGKAP